MDDNILRKHLSQWSNVTILSSWFVVTTEEIDGALVHCISNPIGSRRVAHQIAAQLSDDLRHVIVFAGAVLHQRLEVVASLSN